MTDLNETQKKAFDFAQDLTKQVITLSTAIVTVTISFFKDIVGPTAPAAAKVLLSAGWIVFLVSILFGVITLMGLTGSLSDGQGSITNTNMRRPAIVQHLLFLVGLVLIVSAAIVAL